MSRSMVEQMLINAFNNYVMECGKGQWAYERLNYNVFVKYKELFDQLSEEEQWEVRTVMEAIRQLHGGN